MKKIFSLFAAVLFAGSMMAQVTFTPSDFSAATSAASSASKGGVSVALSSGTIANEVRIFKGQTITFTSESNISKIEFTCTAKGTAKYGPGCFAAQTGYSYETGGSTGTWEGTSTSVTFTAESNQVRATQIVVTLGGAPTPTTKYYLVGSMNEWKGGDAYKFKANPAADGEYMLDLKLAAGNASMKVIGVLEADTTWYPAGVGNDFVINDAGNYTIYFRPAGGQEGWHAGYIYAQHHPLITCAAAAALAKDEVAYLNEVVVTYVNGGNTYVKDASGYELIYEYNFGLVAGDTVNGFIGKSSPYNGLPELKPAGVTLADLDVVPGEAPAPEEITAAPTAADVNKYLVIKGVSVNGEFTTASATNLNATIGEETFILRNNFKIAQTFSEEKKYDIVGVGAIYVKDETTTLQLYFISATESTATGLDNTAVEVKAIKRIENGQLVIIKNGIRYDVTGAVIR